MGGSRPVHDGGVAMNLQLATELAAGYASGPQRARVLTEPWVASQVYCPNCGNHPLTRHPNNSEIGDFNCRTCGETYELKSKRTRFGTVVDDGAYQAMRRRLSGSANPSLFLLNYSLTQMVVTDLVIIPRHFITIDMVEEKPPLVRRRDERAGSGAESVLRRYPRPGGSCWSAAVSSNRGWRCKSNGSAACSCLHRRV